MKDVVAGMQLKLRKWSNQKTVHDFRSVKCVLDYEAEFSSNELLLTFITVNEYA